MHLKYPKIVFLAIFLRPTVGRLRSTAAAARPVEPPTVQLLLFSVMTARPAAAPVNVTVAGKKRGNAIIILQSINV